MVRRIQRKREGSVRKGEHQKSSSVKGTRMVAASEGWQGKKGQHKREGSGRRGQRKKGVA